MKARRAAVLVLLAFSCATRPVRDPLAGSRQAVVVTTAAWSATQGTLQRYERAGTTWQTVGQPIEVVVGRNGLAEEKREGDGKSPSGILPIGTAFGFAPTADFHLPYRPLGAQTECVDDGASVNYNSIVDRDAVPRVDWSSSEKMRSIDQYRWGAVVEHNAAHTPGRGSCIFLHIWSGPQSTTAGCTAMREDDLLTVLRWLDPSAKPVLVQMTRGEYERAKPLG